MTVPEGELYLRSDCCNIYEAGTGVKHDVKPTSPATAHARVIATNSRSSVHETAPS